MRDVFGTVEDHQTKMVFQFSEKLYMYVSIELITKISAEMC